jgi:hypothetical protein
LCLLSSHAYADAALLLAEPYNRPGGFNPVAHAGHAGVYLTRVCAATPTVLRRCRAGEAGVVISRYDRVGVMDWVGIPLMPYLYAVERAADVPTFATSDAVLTLRDDYRRARLHDIFPDPAPGEPPSVRWTQLIGAAYDRQIIAFSVKTTPEQDDALIAEMNGGENRRRFNVFVRNCADFARDLLSRYHPSAMRSSFIADMGFTTPKQIAKALVRHGTRRPDAGFAAYLIPQIPGNRREPARSWCIRVAVEDKEVLSTTGRRAIVGRGRFGHRLCRHGPIRSASPRHARDHACRNRASRPGRGRRARAGLS